MKLQITVHDTRIKNNTSKVAQLNILILEHVFLKFLSKNLHFTGVQDISIHLTLCGKTKIRNLNKEFRSIDKSTDVLSFGVHDNLRPDRKTKLKLPLMIELGDIFICKEVALKQAIHFNITYEQELLHLTTHGFLHLLGFDHEISPKEEKIMEQNESSLLKLIYKKLGNI